jgi:hypothetical protein
MDEFKAKIDELMKNHRYDEALPLIESELAQPYLPPGFLSEYQAYKQEILASKGSKSVSLDAKTCFEMLLHDDNPFLALSQLSEIALMKYTDAIQQVLTHSSNPISTGLLIQLCVEQQLNATFTMNKDGQRIEFIPMYVQSIEESEGYQSIEKLIRDIFENDNPSLMNMALQLLMQESLLILPMNLDQDDTVPIGFAIIKAVLEAMGDQQMWEIIKEHAKISEVELEKLHAFSTH